jgi:hypothetical protein
MLEYIFPCHKGYKYTTPICIQIHYVFHFILIEIEQIYHGENGQPFSKRRLVAMDKQIH